MISVIFNNIYYTEIAIISVSLLLCLLTGDVYRDSCDVA